MTAQNSAAGGALPRPATVLRQCAEPEAHTTAAAPPLGCSHTLPSGGGALATSELAGTALSLGRRNRAAKVGPRPAAPTPAPCSGFARRAPAKILRPRAAREGPPAGQSRGPPARRARAPGESPARARAPCGGPPARERSPADVVRTYGREPFCRRVKPRLPI